MIIEFTIDNRPLWGEVWTPEAVATIPGSRIPVTDGLNRNVYGSATVTSAEIRDDKIWLTLDTDSDEVVQALQSPLAAAVTTINPHTLHELYAAPLEDT